MQQAIRKKTLGIALLLCLGATAQAQIQIYYNYKD
jgi:hypothetical protein